MGTAIHLFDAPLFLTRSRLICSFRGVLQHRERVSQRSGDSDSGFSNEGASGKERGEGT
jgi:hypothetical protein